MGLRYDTVTFLSDYGRTDEFVGVVHSVLRSLAPGVGIVDLTHDIRPHDVRAGGLALARSANYLCPGVVLAVVDPGVGTPRRRIAVEVGEGESVLVGPDNGLLAPVVALCGGATRAVELTNAEFHHEAPGPTFDGRDVFAPVAAALCRGVELTDLGDLVDPHTLMPGILPVIREEEGAIVAEILWVDRFGNGQLNVDPDDIDGWGDRVRLVIDGQPRLALRAETFAAIGTGALGLVIDSYGLVAIAAHRRSAIAELGIGEGTEVRLERLDDDTGNVVEGVTTAVQLGRKGS